jgi:signal transduction histidine kinase
MTPWLWALSALALCLALVAALAAARWCQDGTLGLWLLAGTALWSVSLFHALFWPEGYGQVITTSDALRLAFSLVVAIGAVIELRKLAERRVTKLALEEEHARKLSELAVLKANFTAMVAHELGSPLGAIRGYVAMLATHELDPDAQAEALAVINAEIDALTSLVRDVQTAASVEREDFVVRPRPVSLASILAEAAAFAKTLPGDHPFRTTIAVHEMVWADPDRVRQVLRNLLTNAGKYTPPGKPIELSAARHNSVVRLEVIDHGPGIRYEDVSRIFEKFGRGRDHAGRKIPGVGLGLYLSRRIIQAHGSMLTVASRIEGGSVFGFELEVIL